MLKISSFFRIWVMDLSVVHNCCILKNPKKTKKNQNMYLGHNFLDEEIRNELKKYRLDFIKPNNIEKKIAELLAQKKVIAHFNDKMEFGPFIGNRSILFTASDKNIKIG